MSTNTEPVFTVTFGCHNCGNEWSSDFPPKTAVSDGGIAKRTQVSNDDCDTLGVHNCTCCDIVVCPVCDRDDDVYVDDRNPIKEGDA